MKQIPFSLLLLSIAYLLVGFAPSSPTIRNLPCSDSTLVHPSSHNLLFFLYRNVNNNQIVYELNTDKNGTLDVTNPIHAYWIKHTSEGKKIEELSYIQQKFAYGVNHTLVDSIHHTFHIRFNSYNKKYLLLSKSALDHKYHAYIMLNNKKIQIAHIFVQIEGGSFWVPNIPYIEIAGKDMANGQWIKERIKP